MRDGTIKVLAALACLALVGGAPALAAKGGDKGGGGGGGGGKPAEPAADPAISFLRITSQNEYGSNQTGSLWTIDADGTNKTELIRRGRGQDAGTKVAPSWRPSD